MKNFIQYHNVERMSYSASKLSEPKLYTDKSVKNLSSSRVWLISGEGTSPKQFYLAAVFKVNRVSTGTFDHPDFKNSAYGNGHIIGEKIELNGLAWFEKLKAKLNNFKNGLTEITDPYLIKELETLAVGYVIP
jgi:hypothetical protein